LIDPAAITVQHCYVTVLTGHITGLPRLSVPDWLLTWKQNSV